MKRLSSNVELRKTDEGIGIFWKAYFRGTMNRICQANGAIVPPRSKIADLRYDLLNNPMERGVLAYE